VDQNPLARLESAARRPQNLGDADTASITRALATLKSHGLLCARRGTDLATVWSRFSSSKVRSSMPCLPPVSQFPAIVRVASRHPQRNATRSPFDPCAGPTVTAVFPCSNLVPLPALLSMPSRNSYSWRSTTPHAAIQYDAMTLRYYSNVRRSRRSARSSTASVARSRDPEYHQASPDSDLDLSPDRVHRR